MVEKIVRLNALDLVVSVPQNICFYDDGFVKDLDEHMNILNFRYTGRFLSDPKYLAPKGAAGNLMMLGNKRNFYNFHIFYLNSSFPPIATRGHEETHFLHAVKRLPVLSERILHRQGVEMNFEYVKNEVQDRDDRCEIIAEIGAIFCQYQREGWQSILDFQKSNLPRSGHFEWAMDFYSQAIEDSLKKSKKSEGLFSKLDELVSS